MAYLTAPDPNQTTWPKGVKYIIGNEGCERFSFYGMRSILQVHLTSLFVTAGLFQVTAEENAQEMYHLFVAAVYAFPMIGAIISDRLVGKYGTIISLSLVYCLGHVVLAIGENSIEGMGLGLALIAIGSGGIKPCVSAHVGDQFGKGNWHMVAKVFQGFYFIINFGSFFATLAIPFIRSNADMIPILRDYPEYATSVAFGLPGVLMFVATVMFWMGRHVFVHVPPAPGGKLGLYDAAGSVLLFTGFIGLPLFAWDVLPNYVFWLLTVWSIVMGLWIFMERQSIEEDDGFLAVMIHSIGALLTGGNARAAPADDGASDATAPRRWFFGSAAKKFGDDATEGPKAVLRIISIFFLVSVFWALFDQHGSSWVRQAMRMELNVWNMELLPSQISALNPLMVMALIPINNYFLYPTITKMGYEMTPLRRMTIGMFIASGSFAAVAIIQFFIDQGGETSKVPVLWQFVPYLIITQAEVMVSITGLEFAYTQAPKRMKSTIMGFWLLTVSFGNVLVAAMTKYIPNMELQQFFWMFAALMVVAAVLFGIRARFYTYRDYTQ
jgi:POT family proton-dependent oligopeptide transporter